MEKKVTPIKLGMTLYKLGCYVDAEKTVTGISLKQSAMDGPWIFFDVTLDGHFCSLHGSFPNEEQVLTAETDHVKDKYTADRSVWLESAIKALEEELVEKNELYKKLCNEVIIK